MVDCLYSCRLWAVCGYIICSYLKLQKYKIFGVSWKPVLLVGDLGERRLRWISWTISLGYLSEDKSFAIGSLFAFFLNGYVAFVKVVMHLWNRVIKMIYEDNDYFKQSITRFFIMVRG